MKYSRKSLDGEGVTTYYDSKDEMNNDYRNESLFEFLKDLFSIFNPVTAIFGFVFGVIVSVIYFYGVDTVAIYSKFIIVIIAAISFSYLFGKIGNALLFLGWIIFWVGGVSLFIYLLLTGFKL